MLTIKDTIFSEDNAFLNLIDIIERGQEKFVLAIGKPSFCFSATLSVCDDGRFDVSFNIPDQIFAQVSPEFFCTHDFALLSSEIKILIKNKDICNVQVNLQDNEEAKINLTLDSFSAGPKDDLWEGSRQVALCFYSEKSFHKNKVGVIFELTTLKNQDSPWKNCLKIKVNDAIFLLYFVTTTDETCFFILKSQTSVNHKFFLEVLESCRVAIGLLSGYYINDTVWYFSMKSRDRESLAFRYENNANSIFHEHPLIDNSRYTSIPVEDTKISASQFEQLVHMAYQSIEVRRSLQLLIQAGCISGISKGCLAAVALETIKTKITQQPTGQKGIIDNSEIVLNLKQDLGLVLNRFKDDIDKESFEVLESRLNQIDQSSNANLLKLPFENLGINLSDDDCYCLKCRNFFLHGATIKAKGEFFSKLTQAELVDVISDRLIMLTTILLLKKCGYEGKVIDWGLTKILKKRAICSMQNVAYYGNALRDIKNMASNNK